MTNKQVTDQFGNQYLLKECIGEGAEGAVYRTDVEGKLVKLVKIEATHKESWTEHKKWLVRKNIPSSVQIILPLAVLTGDDLGYVMNEVENHVPLVEWIQKPEDEALSDWYNVKTGGVKKRVEIAANLAKSIRNLHTVGLAFSDLSPMNILVSPTSKSIWIIDPDNITSPGMFNQKVLGTPRYIAPELFHESRSISSLTDTYAYGVLMFEMFRLGHPYIGDDLADASPEEEEQAFKGLYPYIEHPTDDSNRSTVHLPANLILTPAINQLFERLFVEGQENFLKRPTLLEMYREFNLTQDCVNHCSCGASYILQTNCCPWCDTPAQQLTFLNCVKESIVKDAILENGRLTKSKEVAHQILLPLNIWKPVYQHHFNPNVAQEDNIALGTIRLEVDKVVFINRHSDQKPYLVVDRMTKQRKKIEFNDGVVLNAGQTILIQSMTEKLNNYIPELESVKLFNYVELSVEVKK
ncbi:serine/threonine protein kinase [Solibacillus isronensis]|uniref:serine/threonine protein kinase n=1 Tax=Solibacillus isronensis TaxID=412383 RepID=UPI002041AFDC|nr:serine/threonine-protein kinase [Solibacillus isronensis]MCM3721189.1 serine/threonine-protein kinase [Solibacillus isronensis]